MSYILEALRRAEAERQRGAVPGLHAQPVAGTLPDGATGGATTGHRPWRRPVVAGAGLLLAGLLVAAAGLGWLLKPSAQVVAVVTPSAVPAMAQPQPDPLPLAPAVAVPIAPAVAVPIAPAVAVPIAPAVAVPAKPPAKSPAALLQARPAARAPSQDTPLLAAPAAANSGPAVPAPVTVSPGAPPSRLPTLAELPEALRREVQPLNLGGAVYAEQAPLRIVIVNGQVFHEGDKPLPELQVQQIRLKSVVFSVRGQRFEMPL